MELTLTSFWYVLQTKPRQERLAHDNLLRQGYEAILPLVPPSLSLRKPRRGQAEPSPEPLFPGYLFFRPSRETQSIAPVRSTLGVSRIVRFGESPAQMSAQLLDDLLNTIHSGADDLQIKLKGLAEGLLVRVTDGPLAGLQGLVSRVGTERVVVLMTLIGREQPVTMPIHLVEKAT